MTVAEQPLAAVLTETEQHPPPTTELWRTWAAMTSLRGARLPDLRAVYSPDLALSLDILGEAVHRAGPSGARRVPSAGAIFPYETLALCRVADGTGWGLFRIEGAAGGCSRLPMSRAWLRQLITSMPDGPGFDGCYLIVLTRPWLSIRKYGPRGYLYTQLDAAHAAVNILGVALAAGPAVLHAGLPAAAEVALRNGFPPFHEPHSVIGLATGGDYPGDPMVTVRDELPSRRGDQVYDFEAQAWARIVVPLHDPAEATGSAGGGDRPVLAVPDPGPDTGLRGDWRALSAARRSAKRFGVEPLSGARLAGTVAALGTSLPVGLRVHRADDPTVDATAVTATVLVPDRLALGPDEQAAIGRCARLVRYPGTVDGLPADAGTFVAACMGQPHVGQAQAFVLLHGTSRLVAAGSTGHHLRQALFRAGIGGQLIYLAATRNRVGVTTIGGFDAAAWTRLAELPPGTPLLYLLVLGSPVLETGPPRDDRAQKAMAHGES